MTWPLDVNDCGDRFGQRFLKKATFLLRSLGRSSARTHHKEKDERVLFIRLGCLRSPDAALGFQRSTIHSMEGADFWLVGALHAEMQAYRCWPGVL
eukprot:6079150-Amphidinium_carterae.1